MSGASGEARPWQMRCLHGRQHGYVELLLELQGERNPVAPCENAVARLRLSVAFVLPTDHRSKRQGYFTRTAAMLLGLQIPYSATFVGAFIAVLNGADCSYPWRWLAAMEFVQVSMFY